MYETRSTPPLSRVEFLGRFARHAALALGIIGVSLGGGVCGYHWLENLPWLDSLLNASMILGGMGPVDPLKTDDGKLFASFYALYSGMVFFVVAGVLLTPLAHRMLHRFHWDEDVSADPVAANVDK